jgi:hypothetical protein
MGARAIDERERVVTAWVQCPAVRGRGAGFAALAPGRTSASGAVRAVEADVKFNKPVLALGTYTPCICIVSRGGA